MRPFFLGLALALAPFASSAEADVKVTVDGTEVRLSTLMENCKSIKGDPEAQVACFSALSKMLEGQSAGGAQEDATIAKRVDALRQVAEFKDDGSGLTVAADGCLLNVIYYNNYFHISRRNVSTIDIVNVHFDATRLQFDQASMAQSGQDPFSRGIMDVGARAQMRGGIALGSDIQNFEPKSARMPLDAYVNEVLTQLPGREDQVFDFVMIHPSKSGQFAEIWTAFSQLIATCREFRGTKPVS